MGIKMVEFSVLKECLEKSSHKLCVINNSKVENNEKTETEEIEVTCCILLLLCVQYSSALDFRAM